MNKSINRFHFRNSYPFMRTLFAVLIVTAFSVATLPARAGGAEDKAKKAFADWKAAQAAVAAAQAKLADAQKALQNAMAAVAKSGGKATPEQEAALAQGRANIAAAQAALQAAEKQELAARVALEAAIAELPDGPLKDQLKRERNFPSLVTANGLHTVRFDTASGQVTVNLPDDMMAGDTISGTVIAEPKGNTEEERNRNRGELNGYVIQIQDQNFPVKGATIGPMVVRRISGAPPISTDPVLPPQSSFFDVFFQVSLDGISRLGSTRIPVPSSGTVITPDPNQSFLIPPLGQTGRPIVITGPFDGNSANTTINASAMRTNVQDFEKNTENVSAGFGLLAESPRKAVFSSPENVTGPIQITVNEGGKQATGTYRNVGVNLTAPKTSLLKGEKTELRVEVNGLQGITQPVPLTLESRGVITMEGGPYQPLVIQPSQVGADGRYSTTRGITGVQAGGWGATATVVTHQFDFCLQDDSVPTTAILVNSFSGNYIFTAPGGTSLSGNGVVTQNGCIISLTDSRSDRRVQVQLDPCVHSGSASVQTVSPKIKATITDRNTADNTCSCGPGCK